MMMYYDGYRDERGLGSGFLQSELAAARDWKTTPVIQM